MADVLTPLAVTVNVKSAWLSKVNWTQAIGMASTALAVLTANKYSVPADVQVEMVAGIQGVTAAVTWIMKTFYTSTVQATSLTANVIKQGQ